MSILENLLADIGNTMVENTSHPTKWCLNAVPPPRDAFLSRKIFLTSEEELVQPYVFRTGLEMTDKGIQKLQKPDGEKKHDAFVYKVQPVACILVGFFADEFLDEFSVKVGGQSQRTILKSVPHGCFLFALEDRFMLPFLVCVTTTY